MKEHFKFGVNMNPKPGFSVMYGMDKRPLAVVSDEVSKDLNRIITGLPVGNIIKKYVTDLKTAPAFVTSLINAAKENQLHGNMAMLLLDALTLTRDSVALNERNIERLINAYYDTFDSGYYRLLEVNGNPKAFSAEQSSKFNNAFFERMQSREGESLSMEEELKIFEEETFSKQSQDDIFIQEDEVSTAINNEEVAVALDESELFGPAVIDIDKDVTDEIVLSDEEEPTNERDILLGNSLSLEDDSTEELLELHEEEPTISEPIEEPYLSFEELTEVPELNLDFDVEIQEESSDELVFEEEVIAEEPSLTDSLFEEITPLPEMNEINLQDDNLEDALESLLEETETIPELEIQPNLEEEVVAMPEFKLNNQEAEVELDFGEQRFQVNQTETPHYSAPVEDFIPIEPAEEFIEEASGEEVIEEEFFEEETIQEEIVESEPAFEEQVPYTPEISEEERNLLLTPADDIDLDFKYAPEFNQPDPDAGLFGSSPVGDFELPDDDFEEPEMGNLINVPTTNPSNEEVANLTEQLKDVLQVMGQLHLEFDDLSQRLQRIEQAKYRSTMGEDLPTPSALAIREAVYKAKPVGDIEPSLTAKPIDPTRLTSDSEVGYRYVPIEIPHVTVVDSKSLDKINEERRSIARSVSISRGE